MLARIKTGWQTTEWWTTLGTQVILTLVDAGVLSPSSLAKDKPLITSLSVVAQGIVAAAYTLGRSRVKAAASSGPGSSTGATLAP
jgi:hypothetical protein